MLNASEQVLYVGKAKNLRRRLSSYFREHLDHTKTRVLMRQVVDVQVIVTRTENEALLLESNLIKQLKPRYNVLLRDDKSYPYLFLSIHDDFPRLDYYRGSRSAKGRYFGPYPNAKAVRETLELLQRLFQIRQCSNSFFRHRSRPCLQYQIKRCTAPCVGFISQEDYAARIRHVALFLEGKSEQVVEELIEKMAQHSEKRAYEAAGVIRDQIARIRQLQAGQCISGKAEDVDVVSVIGEQHWACVTLLYIRAGRVIGHKPYLFEVPMGTDPAEVLSDFLPQYYSNPVRAESVPSRIILGTKLKDKTWMQSALSELLAHKIRITDQPKVQSKAWVQMAQVNAQQSLSAKLSDTGGYYRRLVSLQKALKMDVLPQRIECFDVSHTQGEATVAACVVFDHQGPANSDYRRFNIRGLTPGDDYAAMKSALERHYQRIQEKSGLLPDILLIDGGKGQLAVAEQVIESLQIRGVLLVGIAKGPERKAGFEALWVSGRRASLHLPPELPGFQLIQAVRDEAHRFAITGHRKQRARARLQSVLESIEGVGPAKRRALLNRFGGLQGVQDASVEALMQVPGINRKLADRIRQQLHTST